VNAQSHPKHKSIIDSTFGPVFMGTPHNGHTDSASIAFGKICTKIVKHVAGNTKKRSPKAVENGSVFSDILKENWRHHLERYQIISCYESLNEVGTSFL
jgi:hypothetical protein